MVVAKLRPEGCFKNKQAKGKGFQPQEDVGRPEVGERGPLEEPKFSVAGGSDGVRGQVAQGGATGIKGTTFSNALIALPRGIA